MNCHHHEFVGLGLASAHSRANNSQGMSEIAIQHNVNQPLTTTYGFTSPETRQQKQRRLTQAAMAKAKAVTKLYGGKLRKSNQQNLPVVEPPPEAPVARANVSEPGSLALNSSFRVSSDRSLLSIEDRSLGRRSSNHSNKGNSKKGPIQSTPIPPPPPLKTQVTDLLMNPSQPVLNAEVVLANPPQPQGKNQPNAKPPPSPHHPSFQSFNELQPLPAYIVPKKPAPTLYPSVSNADAPAERQSRRSSTNNEGGLLRGLVIEEQALMLQRYHEQQNGVSSRSLPIATTLNASGASSSATEDSRTLAVQEQEKLWQQFGCHGHHTQPISPNTAPSARALSPQEEQARLWDQLARNRPRQDPLEEQAQLLHGFKKQNPQLSAVEEQERMLQEFQSNMAKSNPIEQQAQRWNEIQDAKEQRVMDLACQISTTTTPNPRLRSDGEEEELSLEYIMELSRREAEEHNRAQQYLENAVLQKALERSQEDLGCSSFSLQERLRQHEQSVDFELRRSIAELACQSSERTLGSTNNPRSVGVSGGYR